MLPICMIHLNTPVCMAHLNMPRCMHDIDKEPFNYPICTIHCIWTPHQGICCRIYSTCLTKAWAADTACSLLISFDIGTSTCVKMVLVFVRVCFFMCLFPGQDIRQGETPWSLLICLGVGSFIWCHSCTYAVEPVRKRGWSCVRA
jgi:hypothetical protein